MDVHRLHGVQYVRLAPGAAERVAPYLGVAPKDVHELVLDLPVWPAEIRPKPIRARDGRLLAGDPVLLDANESGLLLAGSLASSRDSAAVLVPWDEAGEVYPLR
ncbi:MAG TPA: hypothetical protein VF221_23495 [Chloroflexota bacterium]